MVIECYFGFLLHEMRVRGHRTKIELSLHQSPGYLGSVVVVVVHMAAVKVEAAMVTAVPVLI